MINNDEFSLMFDDEMTGKRDERKQ